MRLHPLLTAAASVALVGALTGCAQSGPGDGTASGGAAVPASSGAPTTRTTGAAADAVDLVGTRWAVHDAAGAAEGTTVRFDGAAITVEDGDRSTTTSWSAQGDQVLVGGSTSSLQGPVATGWLIAATRVTRTASGWTLLDAAGAPTARLTGAGSASPAPTTSPALLETATLGRGVVDAPSTAIEGGWAVSGDPRTAITFSGGRWSATASCTSGAVGGAGAYRVLPGGRLLVTRTRTPISGCPVVQDASRLRGHAITAIARAGSFRVRGDRLTVFDRTGAPLGTLVRA